MPQWSNQPPPNPRGHALPLRRVPPVKGLVTFILSDDLIGTRTHFYHKRTVPCETPNCKACLEGQPYRWHGYIACQDHAGLEPFLLELTDRAAAALVTYRLANGTLRGARLRASRANYAKNSRIIVELEPVDLTKTNLPPEPDVLTALSIIWNLPSPALQRTGGGGLAAAVETLSDVADASRELPIGAYAETLAHRMASQPVTGNGKEH